MVAARALMAVVLAALVVASVTGVGVGMGAAASGEDCVAVSHDLRTDEVVQHWNESESVTSSASNTEVHIEENAAFVQLTASNPNGYCTAVTVDIPSDVVEPAALGDVDAVGTDGVTSTWELQQDLDTGEHYTRVTTEVPAGESATFSPSKARVVALQWTGDAAEGASWLGISNPFGDDLEKNKYEITAPTNSSRVSVPLTEGDKEVEEWRATYSLPGATTGTPVSTDSAAPVYYIDNGQSVEFVFNDKDATVTFVANPGFIDKTKHSVESWANGYERIGEMFGFAALGGVSA